MLLETEPSIDEATYASDTEADLVRKHTVEELLDLLRVDGPDLRVTSSVRRRLAAELALLLAPNDSQLREVIIEYQSRTPEEIYEIRRRNLSRSRPPREIPPGKTWMDMVVGKWPGDETDEQIRKGLEEIE